MIPSFKTLNDFVRVFSDDASCRKYLEHRYWNNIPTCPHCKHQDAYKLKDNKTYKCKNKECKKLFTVTVGTLFENTNTPLTAWFTAIYLLISDKSGISSVNLAQQIGVTQTTAWFMLHRIREAFKLDAPELLEDVVEMDETFIGGKNKNRPFYKRVKNSQGRSFKDKTPVFGILQRKGKLYTQAVENTKAKTLKPIIKEKVKKGSTTITDEWGAYKSLKKEGYKHVIVNHKRGQYADGEYNTNSIEGYWSLLKRGLHGTYHNVSRKHLQKYCNEFTYRYNNRKLDNNAKFALFLANVNSRVTFSKLTARKHVEV